MSMQELKQEILTAVNQTDDEDVLQELKEVLFRESRVSEPAFVLTEGMKASIRAGLDDLANGRVVSHEDVMREWEEQDNEAEKEWSVK